jgi:hypothetical protein
MNIVIKAINIGLLRSQSAAIDNNRPYFAPASHNSVFIPPTGTYLIEKPDTTLRLIQDVL